MLGFAVIGGIGMLAAAGVFAAQQKPKTVAAGTASLRRAEPGTGTGASPSAGSPSAASPAPASLAAPPPADALTPPPHADALTPPSADPGLVTESPANADTAPSADALSAAASAGPPPGPACKDCGRELRPGARFCPVCGRPVADSSARASA
jgi:hypothetical protein